MMSTAMSSSVASLASTSAATMRQYLHIPDKFTMATSYLFEFKSTAESPDNFKQILQPLRSMHRIATDVQLCGCTQKEIDRLSPPGIPEASDCVAN